MADSKKPSNEESILGRIASSIEEIEKIDAENEPQKDMGEDEKNSEENNLDDKFSISSKADELLSDDSKRKFPILPIIGSIIGVILVLLGIFLMLGTSDRVVDSVASGESGTISIFVIFLGVVILGLSLLKFFSKKGPISEAFDNLNDLKLLDEDEYDEKNKDSEDKEKLKDDPNSINIDKTNMNKSKDSNDIDNLNNQNNLDDIDFDDFDEDDINEKNLGNNDSSDTDSLEEHDSSDADFSDNISHNFDNFDDVESNEENSNSDDFDEEKSKDSKENMKNNSLDDDESSINESKYEESLDNFIKDDNSHK